MSRECRRPEMADCPHREGIGCGLPPTSWCVTSYEELRAWNEAKKKGYVVENPHPEIRKKAVGE